MKEAMKVKNPLSDFWKSPKDGSKLTQDVATALFIVTFLHDLNNGVYAEDKRGKKIRLGDQGAEHQDVDKVAGIWRIQEKFPYHVTMVRDKEMVLINKLDRVENTLFEFYNAKLVGNNCYGRFVFEVDKPDYIVAKYETDNETYWGYGKTLEDARAYLGIKVYDAYKDVINVIACKNKIRNGK